jgi:hypothetical protein
MALDRDALSDLLDALRAGGDLDVVRAGMQLVLQALIDLGATEAIAAGRYEHDRYAAFRDCRRASVARSGLAPPTRRRPARTYGRPGAPA